MGPLADVVVAIRKRTFGLLLFANEAEARVLDVTDRGEWPKALPTSILSKNTDTTR